MMQMLTKRTALNLRHDGPGCAPTSNGLWTIVIVETKSLEVGNRTMAYAAVVANLGGTCA